jgi:hypothetical protein
MGADVWDGTEKQVRSLWRAGKGVTMPFLLNASGMGANYGLGNQSFAIIDHEGIFRYKVNSLVSWDFLRSEITQALEEADDTAVEEVATSIPQSFSLSQNAPNPFNSETLIRFELPQPSQVELGIYNLLGQPVALLVQGPSQAGRFAVRWDGRDQEGRPSTSGVYLYRLRVDEGTEVRKLLLLR